jgi:hypothetical protein
MSMKGERVPKKVLEGYVEGRRPCRRPRRRWIDAVDMDAKRMLKCKNWRRLAEDRVVWRWRIEEAKAQVRL